MISSLELVPRTEGTRQFFNVYVHWVLLVQDFGERQKLDKDDVAMQSLKPHDTPSRRRDAFAIVRGRRLPVDDDTVQPPPATDLHSKGSSGDVDTAAAPMAFGGDGTDFDNKRHAGWFAIVRGR